MNKNNPMLGIADLNAGHHAGLLYSNEDEHRAVITEFLRLGLDRREKVFYITDTRSSDLIIEYLIDYGLDIQQPLATGQLTIIHADDAYMKNGKFEPHRVIDTLWDERGIAMPAGYTALRITSEMSWAAKNPSVYKQLAIYEEELNRFLPARPGFGNCLSLCQYDTRKFPAETLLEIFVTHPIVITGKEVCENHNYQPPEVFFSQDRAERALENQLAFLLNKKLTDKALLKSNEQYKSIYENAPVGLQLYSKKGKLLAANRTCLEMFGVSDVSLMEEFNLFKSFSASNTISEKLGTTSVIKFESTVDFSRLKFLNLVDSRKYGTLYLDVTVTEVNPGVRGFQGGYLVCLHDISKRKKDEQYLKKSEDRFRSVIEVASDAILSCDSNGNLISWNNGAEIIFGFTADEMLGQPISTIIAERSRQEFEEQLFTKHRISSETANHIEAFAVRRNGVDFAAEISISRWKAGSGDFFTVIVRDISDRKALENQLLLKERAISCSINAIAIVNLDSEIIYANPAFLRMWGFNDEKEVIGRPATSFWDSPAKATSTIQSIPGKGWIGELMAKKFDGSPFSAQMSSSFVNATENQPACMIASFIALSATNGNGSSKHGVKHGFEEMADIVPDYFTIWDNKLNLKEFNSASSHLFPRELPAEQLKGTNFYTIFPSFNKETWHEKVLSTMATGYPLTVENVNQLIGQQKKYLTLSFIKLDDGIGVIASDRQRSEKELTERNQQLQCCSQIGQLVNSGEKPQMLFEKIVQLLPGLVSCAEKTAARIIFDGHEYCSAKFQASPWKLATEIKVQQQVIGIIELYYKEKRPQRDDGPFTRDERAALRIISVLVSTLAMPSKTASISPEELEQVIDYETSKHIDFTTAMAHEVKTRLTPILSSSDMLATELGEEPWRELAQSVNRGALILDERVNSMLDIARSIAGNFTIDADECSIKDIISEVARNMIPVASYYRQSLVAEVPDNLPKIKADRKRLKQVLTSFLETATKVTPEGGIIKISAKKISGRLHVEVTDTSQGLTGEQTKILQAAKPSTAGRESLSGLGFGLSLGKTIIELHHGDMWITSEKGKGNVFGFTIPLQSKAD